MLRSLECQGPPSFPYVYGWFDGPGPSTSSARVELHTGQLRAISASASLRSQVWGQQPSRADRRTLGPAQRGPAHTGAA